MSRIDEIRARCERATKGPLRSRDLDPIADIHVFVRDELDRNAARDELIAEDVPWLLSRLEAAERVVEAARKFQESWRYLTGNLYPDLAHALADYDAGGDE